MIAELIRLDPQVVQVRCFGCGQCFEIELSEAQEQSWRQGAKIQNVIPFAGEDERELLISGLCSQCDDIPF